MENNYHCDLCKGVTLNCNWCENPSCPNQPCCGRPLKLCNCNHLHIAKLEGMDPHQVFARGEINNDLSETWLYAFDPNIELMWFAVRGVIADWAVYIGPAENGKKWILEYGTKLTRRKVIEKIIPMTEDAWKKYRR